MYPDRPSVTLDGTPALGPWLREREVAGSALLLVDDGVTGTAIEDAVIDQLRSAGTSVERRVVSARGSASHPAERHRVVVGIGGGGVIDQAKLTCLLGSGDGARRRLGATQRCGLVALPRDVRRPQHLVLVPTTVGTGAHVSPNACLEVRGAKRLVNGDCLRADAAVLDPAAVAALPGWLLAEGALENLARVAGVYAGDELDVPAADALVEEVVRDVVRLGYRADDAMDPAGRAELLAMSGRTHGADLVEGRALYIDKCWPLANELSTGLGIRKVQAIAIVLPALWRAIETGTTAAGSARRLARLWDVVRAAAPVALPESAGSGLAALVAHWRIGLDDAARAVGDQSLEEVVDRLAGGAVRAWGAGLPMLRGLDHAAVAALYRDGLLTTQDSGAASAVPAG
ncbi:daptide-type RiPP biosynthesis dehydogenase [Nocardioides sp. LML1-1-1.1]|uniref:daptide-type RiPP biosynthesis dehydogenase n=1 Tax=Nocardioides sp. LML1-1-1.1 TaxID=3135248 RepID=UPI003427F4CB